MLHYIGFPNIAFGKSSMQDLAKINLMLIQNKGWKYHEVSLALVMGRVALFTITVTSKIYTKIGSKQLHSIYIQSKYECMHARILLSDDFENSTKQVHDTETKQDTKFSNQTYLALIQITKLNLYSK